MGPPPVPQRDTSEVKEVTEGVKEVDLDGKDPTQSSDLVDREAAESVVLPESIPLPEEQSGELDQPSPDAPSTPPPVYAPLSSVNGVLEDADAEDSDDVASSSDENTLVPEEDRGEKGRELRSNAEKFKAKFAKTDAKTLDPAESTIEQISNTITTEA